MEERRKRGYRAKAMFAAGLCLLGGLMGWYVSFESTGSRSSDSKPPVVEQAQRQADPQELLQHEQAKRLEAGNTDSVSPTERTLLLVATSPGRSPNEGTAQIGIDEKAPQTYSAGALLANGSALREIYADHVILERDGRRLRVDLHSASETAEADPMLRVGGQPKLPPPQNRRVADSAVDRLMRTMRWSSEYRDDRLYGLRLSPGSSPAVFRGWELERDDIITAIDGAPIVDAEKSAQDLATLTSGRLITVTLEREGTAFDRMLDGSMLQPIEAEATADLIEE